MGSQSFQILSVCFQFIQFFQRHDHAPGPLILFPGDHFAPPDGTGDHCHLRIMNKERILKIIQTCFAEFIYTAFSYKNILKFFCPGKMFPENLLTEIHKIQKVCFHWQAQQCMSAAQPFSGNFSQNNQGTVRFRHCFPFYILFSYNIDILLFQMDPFSIKADSPKTGLILSRNKDTVWNF